MTRAIQRLRGLFRGDPTPSSTIYVNGGPISVAPNLHQALLRLRQSGNTGVWLWIDAICISQEDDQEKNWQVVQMGDIFGGAALVYIWLGPSSDGSDMVLQMAQRVGPGRTPGDGSLRSPESLEAIESLLSRANWYRVWVVQETALARDALVLCGDECVSREAFDAALATIFFCKTGNFARGLPQWRRFGSDLNNNLFRLRGLTARRQRRRNKGAGLVEFLVSDFAAAPKRPFYLASNSRDITFGLLGVAVDTELLGLVPDYTLTTPEVYTAATRAMNGRCPYYSLDFCASPKGMLDLPSWVPDWQLIGHIGLCGLLSSLDVFESSTDPSSDSFWRTLVADWMGW
ncbi:hypothetical protein ACHAQH_001663 [Verticillium albo-atrum]